MYSSESLLTYVTLFILQRFVQITCLIDPFLLFPPLKQCYCGVANDNKTRDVDALKIIGGTVTGYHEFPWSVQVLHKNLTVCGGTIISDLFVLTAAHCYRNDFKQTRLKVIIGQHDMCSNNNDVTVLSVRKIIQHEEYDIRTYYADIMLLKLSMRMTFSKFIAPICLPRFKFDVQQLYFGRRGVIVGWGVFEIDSLALSCEPRKVYVPILSKNQCGNVTYTSAVFCAGYLEGGTGFCDGDSGGPFMLRNDYGQYEVIGITSNSFGCAEQGQPGVYTDVTAFLPWILRHVYGSKWC
ncbi:hypothetical protein Trydic_g3765 [Trypoxylus dichotomus]